MTLCLDRVTARIAQIEVLKELTACFRENEFVLLTGANGAGKTMLASHLMGLYRSYTGTITLDGRALSSQLRELRRSAAMVCQEAEKLIVGQTVEAELRFTPENLGLDDVDRRVETISCRFGLQAMLSRNPATLSGGERRRLAIAAALISDPKFIVFDEPFLSLDYPSTRSFLRILLELQQEQRGILVITHEYARVLAHADRLVVMNQGSIVFDGSPVQGVELFPRYGLQPAEGPVSRMSWL